MWFKQLATWPQGKLRTHHLFYSILYLSFALVIPCIIIGIKYNLIKSSSIRLTGMGMILVVILAVFLFKGVLKIFLKLPQDTHKEQLLKFNILMVYHLIIPIILLFLINLIKQNVMLACDTLTKCIASFITATIIDYTTLKYLEVEFDLRKEARHKIEVDKRTAIFTK